MKIYGALQAAFQGRLILKEYIEIGIYGHFDHPDSEDGRMCLVVIQRTLPTSDLER
jgi:hypothetical protein